MDLPVILPCDGCGVERSSCVRACSKLHKFLREDKKCHTRVQTTELPLPRDAVIGIIDRQAIQGTSLTWQDMAEGTLGYWDIELAKHLTDGEKAMISCFYVEGMSYQQIADRYHISLTTVKRQLIKIKKHLRKVCSSDL